MGHTGCSRDSARWHRVLTKILKPCNNSPSVRCALHSTIVWVIIAGSKVPFPRMCLWARFQADPRSTSYFVQGCAVSRWPVEDSELQREVPEHTFQLLSLGCHRGSQAGSGFLPRPSLAGPKDQSVAVDCPGSGLGVGPLPS